MKFGAGWVEFFAEQVAKRPFQKAANTVQEQRNAGKEIYPPEGHVFDAYALTPLEDLKAVIMVDEPYSSPKLSGSGVALSTPPNQPIPQTLMNVFMELRRDLGVPIPGSGDLTEWAEAGILLVSNVLTVRRSKPSSHRDVGWQSYSADLVKHISDKKEGVVFAFWGSGAGKNAKYIDKSKHTVLTTSDPSKVFEGFSGCGHFAQINNVCNLWSSTNE